MKTVAVYEQQGHPRARAICRAMAHGIIASGDRAVLEPLSGRCAVSADAAVFYGFVNPLPRLMREYRAQGKPAVHIDLGYWGRMEGGRLKGYHKVAVDARHPEAYFQNRKHAPDRVSVFGLKPAPWRKGGKHILLVGMSAKHARSEGWAAKEWETEAVRMLREVTDRPIVYRPKPSDREASPIEGTTYARAGRIEEYLPDCHAVVTHHSNAAIEAAVYGVPSFSQCGVGAAIGSRDLSKIENPVHPEGREQWLADIAYCQFNLREMQTGVCWRHLRAENLV